tara:strand:- start:88 stop:240 length:153 start_codon:yes stop_codon:yes gene_type:complete
MDAIVIQCIAVVKKIIVKRGEIILKNFFELKINKIDKIRMIPYDKVDINL